MKLFILLITISITLAAVIKHPDDNNNEMSAPNAVLELKDVESVVTEDTLLPETTDVKRVKRDFWDGVPFISQFKSAIQAMQGDLDGARETQENFTKQALVISQWRSAVEAASGDHDAARRTQEQFVGQTLKGYENMGRKILETAATG